MSQQKIKYIRCYFNKCTHLGLYEFVISSLNVLLILVWVNWIAVGVFYMVSILLKDY